MRCSAKKKTLNLLRRRHNARQYRAVTQSVHTIARRRRRQSATTTFALVDSISRSAAAALVCVHKCATYARRAGLQPPAPPHFHLCYVLCIRVRCVCACTCRALIRSIDVGAIACRCFVLPSSMRRRRRRQPFVLLLLRHDGRLGGWISSALGNASTSSSSCTGRKRRMMFAIITLNKPQHPMRLVNGAVAASSASSHRSNAK